MPFVYLWKIIGEVIEVAPNFSKAADITHNGWMAVIFSLIYMLVYLVVLSGVVQVKLCLMVEE